MPKPMVAFRAVGKAEPLQKLRLRFGSCGNWQQALLVEVLTQFPAYCWCLLALAQLI
jgi:hypothetical protein